MAKDWITKSHGKLQLDRNKLLRRNWDNLEKLVAPVPYDYYLRDFKYMINKIDIEKNNSLIYPYQAIIKLTEKLYIEAYHSSDANDITPYLYTVTTGFLMNLEYRDSKFVVINTEFGKNAIDTGWEGKRIR